MRTRKRIPMRDPGITLKNGIVRSVIGTKCFEHI